MLLRICVAFALIILIIFFMRSFSPSNSLKALEKTTSVLQIQSGHEVSRTIYDERKVMGDIQDAEIDLKFEPVNQQSSKAVFEEITEILQRNNWQRKDTGKVSGYYSASTKNGYQTLVVEVAYDPNSKNIFVQFYNRR